ncbi:ZNF195 [Xyrichtys novacula]|uniref:ZNF195 n=1 Tax=Xyrichtys novacula TaxID=13765 RepID=A0AAV1GWS9_XYRNO|nr:ZNF195 [Xyrichtys novacula]
MCINFFGGQLTLTIIVAYAPTEVADDETKNAFFDQLHQVILQVPPHDITIVLADFNATVSSASRDPQTKNIIGPESPDPITNNNGDRLQHLCSAGGLSIVDTWFPRKNIHKWTWYSNDGKTCKALDHIIISSRWKSSVTNCRMYRGAQLGNMDNRLLVAQLRLKLKAVPSSRAPPRVRSSHLQDPTITSAFTSSISNRYNTLAREELTNWNLFVSTLKQAAADSIQRPHHTPRRPWISPTTLEIIELRRAARLRGDMIEYRRLNRIRNTAIQEDRERFWQGEAERLESAAENNNYTQVYRTQGHRNLCRHHFLQ